MANISLYRLGVDIAPEMAGEHLRLQIGNEAERRFFVEERMLALIFLAFLPGGEDYLASFVFEAHGAAVFGDEILRLKLLAVDQRKRQTVSEHGPQFLHKVEGKRRPPRAVAMQEAYRRIEADCFGCRTAVVGEQ